MLLLRGPPEGTIRPTCSQFPLQTSPRRVTVPVLVKDGKPCGGSSSSSANSANSDGSLGGGVGGGAGLAGGIGGGVGIGGGHHDVLGLNSHHHLLEEHHMTCEWGTNNLM